MNNSTNLNESLVQQMNTSVINSFKSSSSTSISSLYESATSELDVILNLIAVIDLNPALFKSQTGSNCSITTNDDDQISFNKEKLIQYLKSYLENESNQAQSMTSMEEEDNNEIKLNELKSVLLSENDSEISWKPIKEDDHLPRNLLVTSLCDQVFTNDEIKSQFEQMFVDLKCKFCYLPSFRRCYIQFDSPVAAILARVQLYDQKFLNEPLKVFLNKPVKLKNSRNFLEAPQSDKLFLISPPSSPPVGWEQEFEEPPNVNLDLLAAISQMDPNEPCEIVKSKDNLPSIVIHPCPDLNEPLENFNLKRKFMPTRRPANQM